MAIGDGANDAAMIVEAHIGVGLYGKEGLRAVQSSDYAIVNFQCLWVLLFTHGRLSYFRITEMIKYFFYKNMILFIMQFSYSFFSAFQGINLFDSYYISFYNLFFTSLPVMIRAIFEQDLQMYSWVKEKVGGGQKLVLKRYDAFKDYIPFLYYIGSQNILFGANNILFWMLNAIFYGVLIQLAVYFIYFNITVYSVGNAVDFEFYTITLFTVVIITIDYKILLHTFQMSPVFIVSVFVFSLGIYFAFTFLYDAVNSSNVYYKIQSDIYFSIYFYSVVLIIIASNLIFDILLYIYDIEFSTKLNYIFRLFLFRLKENSELEQSH